VGYPESKISLLHAYEIFFGEKWEMFEEKVLRSVAMQLMNGEEVVLDDQKLTVKRVR